ncbi:hypothetical protein [Rhizobium sp. RU36D]|uniref:hypothetical protein n=1 Tax=Rhizobium sp. RU36D TaxID=1907415 RepID=UPI000A044B9A|nr:hypothetical protein [Rhizobium sp. RU36D]
MLAFTVAISCGFQASAAVLHCAADDASLRMVIEGARGTSSGEKLTRLRGVMAVKEENGPELLKKVTFSSGMLREARFGDARLQMAIGSHSRTWRGIERFDLVLEADVPDANAASFKGRYALSAEWGQGAKDPERKSAEYAGTVSCAYR